jgi:phage tail tape-measure protein
MDLNREKIEPPPSANPDPLTKESGAHPVGTGIGASGGAAAGAAVGAVVGGPVGAVAGGAIGAIAGGLAGHAAGEAVNPSVEDAYWQENYKNRPYFNSGRLYADYQPAYRYGWESANRHAGKRFEDMEAELEHGWNQTAGRLPWNESRNATRDAWTRVRGH